MKSQVYFINFRTSARENLLEKIDRLIKKAGLAKIIAPRDLTAIKLHFGEMGNTAYLNPVFIRQISQSIKKCGGVPFITDANTLYAGSRSDSPSHITTAIQNGFAYSSVDNTPLIIADGLRGRSETVVQINRKNFKDVYIGSEIIEADCLISVAHFKGHELSGFGGTLKNLGMGCASRRGKLAQHSTVSPTVKRKKCKGCQECISHCPKNAISLINEKAVINQKECIGCGECIIICSENAVQIKWNQSIPTFLENMIEYTDGVLQNKKTKSLFINFITNVSPACDCLSYSDAPIVQDIGILASTDPIAIDMASVDLVNSQHGLEGTCLKTNLQPNEDKFQGLYPNVDWKIQLQYGEEIGLGIRDYELVTVDSLNNDA